MCSFRIGKYTFSNTRIAGTKKGGPGAALFKSRTYTRYSSAFTMSSHIAFASANNIIVLSW